MSTAKSKIEWTESTWNPIRGCTRVSPGCFNCYAERQAYRFAADGLPFEGLVRITNGRPQWTGEIDFVKDALDQPLRWTKPQMIFVNSMSDLFHKGVTDHHLDSIFAVMALARQHVFQVLTKRPERMFEYLSESGRKSAIIEQMGSVAFDEWTIKGRSGKLPAGTSFDQQMRVKDFPWPLPNVWLGVSVENQEWADKRIPWLQRTPAAVRLLSCEPLLGFIDLRGKDGQGSALDPYENDPKIDWVIVGGESGPGARPFSLRWARAIVKQCSEAGVPVFVKQLGAKPCSPSCASVDCTHPDCDPGWMKLKDRKGGNIEEWPKDLQVREFPKTGK